MTSRLSLSITKTVFVFYTRLQMWNWLSYLYCKARIITNEQRKAEKERGFRLLRHCREVSCVARSKVTVGNYGCV